MSKNGTELTMRFDLFEAGKGRLGRGAIALTLERELSSEEKAELVGMFMVLGALAESKATGGPALPAAFRFAGVKLFNLRALEEEDDV